MTKQIGMWIDHRKAVIVTMMKGKQKLETINSNMEKHIRPTGGSRSKLPYGPQDVMKEDGRERKYQLHLKQWYEEVREKVKEADELIVFGPGEGKKEFCKHIEGTALAEHLRDVETVDKLTDGQIVAKVREHFGHTRKLNLQPYY